MAEVRDFERLGNPRTVSVNVRIIASPLRDRIEDIPLLVWAFVKEFEKSMGKPITKIPQNSIDALHQYPWPGNIRELRNVVKNAMIISKDRILKLIRNGNYNFSLR